MFRCYGEVRVCNEPVLKVITGNPELKTKDSKVVNIVGVWNEEVKSSRDDTKDVRTIPHYLNFEVWDSAADYMMANLKKGDNLIVLDSAVKHNSWEFEGKKHHKVVFRIKNFRILPKQDYKE